MRYLTLVVIGFVVLCGWMVLESGVFDYRRPNSGACILLQSTPENQNRGAANAPSEEPPRITADNSVTFGADSAAPASVILGSVDPNSGYNFQLELSSLGAAIRRATFSGFDDRDYKNPQPLEILSPIYKADGSEILSMANAGFQNDALVQQKRALPLQKLHWKSFGVEKASDGSQQTARFETTIKIQDTNEQVLKLTKTYKIIRGSYLLECNITVENLSDTQQKVRFDLSGPGGLGREGIRADMRKVVAGFRDPKNQINSVRLEKKHLIKAKSLDERRLKTTEKFLWAAAVNKYFAAIVVPLPDEGKDYCDWITDKTGQLYNPDGDRKADSGDEAIGLDLKIAPGTLAATGQADSSKTYNFQLYIGPKDKSLFDKNEQYRKLGFFQTIDFMGCCCPAGIIKPLAFGILAIMKWMYGFIGNYGVVIIILVFLMRLAMHPITKKSQISMSKMSKLAPMSEEIKKKYANNKAEMNKQMMALYRKQGASPIMGFLPMMVQMPIWIALWSAVYASIELRGAPFLPFWITDLSMPDALYRFPTEIVLPLLGWKIASLNLLPLMMGVAFYLQQKLMPSQASAASNPQVAQQQKMMMIMMPLMFPLMLYNAPSGVNLYIMSSTFAGVFEQYVIRKHIREKEEVESQGLVAVTSKTGGKVKKKKPKPFYKNM
ncbi:MAG: YidC/Oxa1 family insertase periplasmic-domain containing protein [Planctomycetes bacterium]|nr:YidC/Oxa1 family insertase periplasmic-domain containing protein [Planctomycetota bacterium]MBL7144299.1 YidC/Oxa1 family insertase periplasmic-domain containing protein [Phycisphaerae bacterium]